LYRDFSENRSWCNGRLSLGCWWVGRIKHWIRGWQADSIIDQSGNMQFNSGISGYSSSGPGGCGPPGSQSSENVWNHSASDCTSDLSNCALDSGRQS
jgi:hypothetical protein